MCIDQELAKAPSGRAPRRTSMRRHHWLLTLVLITGVSAGQAPAHWKHFVSSNGFSTSYPSTWLRRGVSLTDLEIVDSKQGAEGMIASTTQRRIVVLAKKTTESFAAFRSRYIRELTILRRSDAPRQNAAVNACNEPEVIVGSEPVVPPGDVPKTPPNFIHTMYFCQVADKEFLTILTNIEGDAYQPAYQKVALQMTRNIRLNK